MPKAGEKGFTLQVPLDASGVKDFKPDRAVKVVAYDAKGRAYEDTVKFDQKGKGTATLSLPEAPGRLRIVVGPESASAEQLRGLQTIAVDLSPGQWRDKRELTLSPIAISAYYWWWWWWWCRNFKITGRVVCADGSPVPGAQVCAYDVDWWWWWWSSDLVGCATTDVTGSFEIDFTRCCGWWPWWWWANRSWMLEPTLVDRITALLRRDPKFRKLPIPDPAPDLDIFHGLLASSGPSAQPGIAAAQNLAVGRAGGSKINPATLETLGTRLLKVLPAAPEFERLQLWPWWPWWPWWDCDADIIFKVTQNCGGKSQVIVDETLWNTRWDIPTNFNVTLVANDQACCIVQCTDPAKCPTGDCVLLSDICDDNVGSIGGNIGAPASPVGLLNPGFVSIYGDRPYAGAMAIEGSVGDTVDYYEFLVSTTGFGGPWAPLTAAAVGGFNRQVFVPPASWPVVPFPATTVSDGVTNHTVIETIGHYEANNGPQLWDAASFDLLMELLTQNVLSNGTYYLQMRGWTRPGYAGNLTNSRILPMCGTANPNGVVVSIDNQTTNTPGPTDFNGLPCGAGTVHVCTGQPETDILQVLIVHKDGTTSPLGPCDNICVYDTDSLQIDFAAYDPDAFLAFYTLSLNYGPSLTIDLLSLGGTLTPSPIPPVWAPPAAQVGADYASARLAGAVAPSWSGGAIRLVVSAKLAFPETCCYQLQLYAFKRTIGNCNHSFWNQYNLSESSFTVNRSCPAPA